MAEVYGIPHLSSNAAHTAKKVRLSFRPTVPYSEERRTRSHRLIVRGAVFESIVPEAKDMTDEEAAALLRLALTSEPAREYLKKRAEGATG